MLVAPRLSSEVVVAPRPVDDLEVFEPKYLVADARKGKEGSRVPGMG